MADAPIGKQVPRLRVRGRDGRRSASTRTRSASPTPSTTIPTRRSAAGFRGVVAPPMFCVVYSAGAMGPAILDPELGINLMLMVHGEQEFEWGEPVCAGDTITTDGAVKDVFEKKGMTFYVFESESKQPGRPTDREGHLDQHREGRLMANGHQARARRRGAGAERHSRQVRPAPLRGRVGRLQPDPHRPRVREGGRPAAEHPARPLLDGPGRAGGDAGRRRRSALAEAPVGAVPRHGRPRAGDQGDGHRARGAATAASWSTRSPSRPATRSCATPRRSWSLGRRPSGLLARAPPYN